MDMTKTVEVSSKARAKALRHAMVGDKGSLKLTANQRRALTRSAASGRFINKSAASGRFVTKSTAK